MIGTKFGESASASDSDNDDHICSCDADAVAAKEAIMLQWVIDGPIRATTAGDAVA